MPVQKTFCSICNPNTMVCPALALYAGTLEELSLITRGKSARQLARMTNLSFFL